jgi:hypothetical protein
MTCALICCRNSLQQSINLSLEINLIASATAYISRNQYNISCKDVQNSVYVLGFAMPSLYTFMGDHIEMVLCLAAVLIIIAL